MNDFSSFMTYALVAVFAQNMVISGSSGLTGALAVGVSSPRRTLAVSGFVSLFATLGSLAVMPFIRYLPVETAYMPLHGLILGAAILIFYLIACVVVSGMPSIKKTVLPLLAPAALNGAVMGMPLVANLNGVGDLAGIAGLAFGSGIGFLLAVVLIALGKQAADSPAAPPALRGVPLLVIYIGILSLALSAFGGGMRVI